MLHLDMFVLSNNQNIMLPSTDSFIHPSCLGSDLKWLANEGNDITGNIYN